MSPSNEWIYIPNWEKFQHYKGRRPVWIKCYTELLRDDNYLALSFRQRGILHGIWLLYAESRLVLGSSPARLGKLLGDESVRRRDLEALCHAGFIKLSASKPLAPRYQDASPEEETDTEVETEKKEQTQGLSVLRGNGDKPEEMSIKTTIRESLAQAAAAQEQP